ncbi:hypothetical protein [Streptomyces purpureus]|uniref:Uncharacterized protein n=1 Tax=Streptomyces purpureus TaxID=1951 RepID=A0A918LSK6_9ACTN|nr:hypothetical protein [Streptomyces purpureus]GGT43499.1 hypothetical protein GCM10014713_41520 [Streptomyces purpureus]
MTAEFDAQLVAYFETRARQREQEIDDRLAELTPRERGLIRDAAVMGYVLGRRHPEDKPHPTDTLVMRAVVYAALREDGNYYAVLRGAANQYTEPGAAT